VLVGTVSLLLLLVGRGVLVGRVVVGIRVILRGNARVVDVALVLAPPVICAVQCAQPPYNISPLS
jgi:hypothetical protein